MAGRQGERESYRISCVCVSLCAHVCTEKMYLCIRLCARRQWYDYVMVVFQSSISRTYIHITCIHVYKHTSINAGRNVLSHTGTDIPGPLPYTYELSRHFPAISGRIFLLRPWLLPAALDWSPLDPSFCLTEFEGQPTKYKL